MSLSNFQKRVLSSLVLLPLVVGAILQGGVLFQSVSVFLGAALLYEWACLVYKKFHHWAITLALGSLYLITVMVMLNFMVRVDAVLVLFLVLALAAIDVGAYVAGRQFGGPKLAPKISPKKTWAGVAGGVLGAFVALVSWRQEVSIHLLFWAVVLTFLAQAGDLTISFFKRKAGVKDTSQLIPGHGGVLDRFDSYLFIIPLLAWGAILEMRMEASI